MAKKDIEEIDETIIEKTNETESFFLPKTEEIKQGTNINSLT